LVLPAIADTTTATSWPASTSRFTCSATLRMRVDIGDGCAAEFHHEAAHDDWCIPQEDK